MTDSYTSSLLSKSLHPTFARKLRDIDNALEEKIVTINGTADEIIVTTIDDDEVTISIDPDYLPVHALGQTDEIDVTDNADGTVTFSISPNFEIEDIPTTFTDGSIPYADTGYLVEDNSDLFYDDAGPYLGVGLNDPGYGIEVGDDFAVRTGTTNLFGASPNDVFSISESVQLAGFTTAQMLCGQVTTPLGNSKGFAMCAGLYLLQNAGDLIAPIPTILMTDASGTSATQGAISHDPATQIMDYNATYVRTHTGRSDPRFSVGDDGSFDASFKVKSAVSIPRVMLQHNSNTGDLYFEFKYNASGNDNILMGIDGSETNDPFVITSSTGDTLATSDYRAVLDRDNGWWGFGKTAKIPIEGHEFVDVDDIFLDLIADVDNSDPDDLAIEFRGFVNGQSGTGTQKLGLGYNETDDEVQLSYGAASNGHLTINSSGQIGINKTATELVDINMSTEDLAFIDAGSAGATEQDWIEVKVGGNTGYIRVFAGK